MDLELATLEDITAELIKRNQQFMLALPHGSNGNQMELHCHGIPADVCLDMLQDSAGLFSAIVNGGPVPENVTITERMMKDGQILREQTVELQQGESIDPWDARWNPPTDEEKQSGYNPWDVEG